MGKVSYFFNFLKDLKHECYKIDWIGKDELVKKVFSFILINMIFFTVVCFDDIIVYKLLYKFLID